VRSRAIALLAVALLGACRQLELEPVAPSPEAVLLPVPVVPQDELWECGLASVSALLAYHGLEMEPAERERLVETARREEGLSGAEIRDALERSGLEVFLFSGTLDRGPAGLYGHVDKGRPPLVMISVDEGRFHYALFTGYDPPADNVILVDPRRGRLVLPSAAFERLWEPADRFTLLCTPQPPR